MFGNQLLWQWWSVVSNLVFGVDCPSTIELLFAATTVVQASGQKLKDKIPQTTKIIPMHFTRLARVYVLAGYCTYIYYIYISHFWFYYSISMMTETAVGTLDLLYCFSQLLSSSLSLHCCFPDIFYSLHFSFMHCNVVIILQYFTLWFCSILWIAVPLYPLFFFFLP